jgi:hypothetical protein
LRWAEEEMAHLCANDDIRLLRQDVDELAFSLVTPLRPQHRHHLPKPVVLARRHR